MIVVSTTSQTCHESNCALLKDTNARYTYHIDQVKFPSKIIHTNRIHEGIERSASTCKDLQDSNSFGTVHKGEYFGDVGVGQWLHNAVHCVVEENQGNNGYSFRVRPVLGIAGADTSPKREDDSHTDKSGQILDTARQERGQKGASSGADPHPALFGGNGLVAIHCVKETPHLGGKLTERDRLITFCVFLSVTPTVARTLAR